MLRIPLSLLVALLTAVVTAVAMTAYAVFQYFNQSHGGADPHSVVGLALEHGWHVLALGAATYVVLFIVLDRVVAQPIRALYVKLYAVARGDLTPTDVHSRVAEIQEVADGINMMLSQITSLNALKGMIDLARHAHMQLVTVLKSEGNDVSAEAHRHLAAVDTELAKLIDATRSIPLSKDEKART
jgi:methyl-accepting chemotaxis protein